MDPHALLAVSTGTTPARSESFLSGGRGRRRAFSACAQLNAAATSAAYGVLVRLYPARQAQLDLALAESLAQVRDGETKNQGVALGDEVPAQIVALRANDGSGDGLPYTPPNTIELSWSQGEALAQNVIDTFYIRRGRGDQDDDDDEQEDGRRRER